MYHKPATVSINNKTINLICKSKKIKLSNKNYITINKILNEYIKNYKENLNDEFHTNKDVILCKVVETELEINKYLNEVFKEQVIKLKYKESIFSHSKLLIVKNKNRDIQELILNIFTNKNEEIQNYVDQSIYFYRERNKKLSLKELNNQELFYFDLTRMLKVINYSSNINDFLIKNKYTNNTNSTNLIFLPTPKVNNKVIVYKKETIYYLNTQISLNTIRKIPVITYYIIYLDNLHAKQKINIANYIKVDIEKYDNIIQKQHLNNIIFKNNKEAVNIIKELIPLVSIKEKEIKEINNLISKFKGSLLSDFINESKYILNILYEYINIIHKQKLNKEITQKKINCKNIFLKQVVDKNKEIFIRHRSYLTPSNISYKEKDNKVIVEHETTIQMFDKLINKRLLSITDNMFNDNKGYLILPTENILKENLDDLLKDKYSELINTDIKYNNNIKIIILYKYIKYYLYYTLMMCRIFMKTNNIDDLEDSKYIKIMADQFNIVKNIYHILSIRVLEPLTIEYSKIENEHNTTIRNNIEFHNDKTAFLKELIVKQINRKIINNIFRNLNPEYTNKNIEKDIKKNIKYFLKDDFIYTKESRYTLNIKPSVEIDTIISGEKAHPHLGSGYSQDPCYGDFTTPIVQLLEDNKTIECTYIVNEFLNHYNLNDEWGRSAFSWGTNKKVIDNLFKYINTIPEDNFFWKGFTQGLHITFIDIDKDVHSLSARISKTICTKYLTKDHDCNTISSIYMFNELNNINIIPGDLVDDLEYYYEE